jgi:cupredoxin-like protein
MFKTARFLLAALAVFIVAGSTAPAFAAAPPTWKSVSVTLHADEQPSKLLVSGELPSGAKLPYEAELAVPAGMQIQWVGEILGGAASADPAMTYVKTSTTQGMDIYRFTLTKARIAQFEGVVQGMTGTDGTNQTAALKWTAWQAVPSVTLATRVLRGTQIAQAAPGATSQSGEDGYDYYSKTIQNVKAGDAVDLTFGFTAGAGAATGPTSTTGADSAIVPLVLILALAIGGMGIAAFAVRRKMTVKAAAAAAAAAPKRKKASAAAQQAEQVPSKGRAKRAVEAPAPPARKRTMLVPTIAVIGAFVVGAAAIAVASTGAPVVDGKITKNFGAASPCTSASIPVTANEGVDLASQGGKLLDAFKGKDGVGVATIDIARSVVDITFCESSQSEESVRQMLSGTGLVTVGAAQPASPPAPAKLSKSGKKQTASVGTEGEVYTPSQLLLKAGVPAEIEFAQATGCLAQVTFTQLGITQDLSAGPVTVKVPALEPGTYDFQCGQGHVKGQLVVE